MLMDVVSCRSEALSASTQDRHLILSVENVVSVACGYNQTTSENVCVGLDVTVHIKCLMKNHTCNGSNQTGDLLDDDLYVSCECFVLMKTFDLCEWMTWLPRCQ